MKLVSKLKLHTFLKAPTLKHSAHSYSVCVNGVETAKHQARERSKV